MAQVTKDREFESMLEGLAGKEAGTSAVAAAISANTGQTDREKALALLAAADKVLCAGNQSPHAPKSALEPFEPISPADVPAPAATEKRVKVSYPSIAGVKRYFMPNSGDFGGGTARTIGENLRNTADAAAQIGPIGKKCFTIHIR